MTPNTESPDGGNSEPKNPAPRARKRRGLHVVAVIIAVCALIALALTYVPSHVARSLLADELEALGVDAAGIETLTVDIWASEVWFGPVEFRVGTEQPAQLVELGLAYDPGALFQRRVVVDRLIVRGLDVRVERAADGAFSIDGVPLARLLPAEEIAEPADAGAEEGGGWHVGLLDLQLRDARVALAEADGGVVQLAVARLDMRDFQNWSPDMPGTFSADGSVNDIAFRWQGEARPFAERIAVTADGRIDGVRLDRIERYTGGLGFDRREATLDSTFRHDVQVFPDGRIEVRSEGAATVSGIDLAHESGFEVDGEVIALEVDTALISEAPGRADISGTISGGLQGITVTEAGGEKIGLDTARVSAPEFRLVGDGSGGWRIEAAPRITADGVRLDGTAAGQVERLSVEVGPLSAELGADGSLDIAANPRTDLAGAALTAPLAGTMETLSVVTEGLKARVGANELELTASAIGFALGALRLDLDEDIGGPAMTVASEGAAANLADASFGLKDGVRGWRASLDAKVSSVTATLAEEGAGTIDIGRLEARTFTVDETLTIAGDEVIVGALRAEMTNRAIAAIPPSPGGEGGDDEGAAPTLRLGTLRFEDGVHVALQDGSVEPAVSSDIQFKELEVRNIDTGDPGRPMALHLLGTINEFAEIAADGAIAPLKDDLDFDLTASLRNVELHPLSPYAEQMLGTRLDSGRLTVEVAGKAAAGVLEGQADVDLLGVAFEPLSAEDAERLSENIGAPIETVVGLLEDGEGRIKLTLPVSGTVAEPEVDLSEAVAKAVGGVLSQLFPPTAIAGMLSDLGSGGGMFPPVVFAPNWDVLDEAGRTDTAELVNLLTERPKLSIKVCGRATKTDLDAHVATAMEQAAKDLAAAKPAAGAKPEKGAKEAEPTSALPDPEQIAQDAEPAMRELAAKRTVAFRRYLADEAGIPAERVSECRPDFDPADTGLPRVEVRL